MRAADAAALTASHSGPKIGLVLSGGGARGLAHIGVLQVLEQARIPIDVAVGTSMGAIVAGAYACGTAPQEMERRVLAADWDALLSDLAPREDRSFRNKWLQRYNIYSLEVGVRGGRLKLPRGAVIGQEIERFFGGLTGYPGVVKSFDTLQIPYRSIATDVATGEAVVLDHGDVVAGMRASMSVPGVFAPQEIDGRVLIDGGLVRNLGVDVARSMGAEVIIAVNVGTPLMKQEDVASALDVSVQMINILTEENVKRSLAELQAGDVLISPALGDVDSTAFARGKETIPIGLAAAYASLPKLQRYSLSDEEYRAWRAAQRARYRAPPLSRAVRIDTSRLRRVHPQSVAPLVQLHGATQEDQDAIEEAVKTLHATDDFQQVRFRFEGPLDTRTLVLEPVEKAWGPNYLRFGLNLASDLEGDSSFRLLVDSRQTWINSRGLEWRNTLQVGDSRLWWSELYQPLDSPRRWFVAPQIRWREELEDLFVDERVGGSYTVREGLFALDIGRRFGRAAEARIGLERGWRSFTSDAALLQFEDSTDDVGNLVASYVYDALDHWALPTRGSYLNVTGRLARPGLGDEWAYEALHGQYTTAVAMGRYSVALGLEGGSALGSEIPNGSQFALGGFLQLSGYRHGRFLTNEYALGRLFAFRRLTDAVPMLSGVFLGGSLEVAKLGDRTNGEPPNELLKSGSLFLAGDTALGPAVLAAGYADGNNIAYYLFLGRPR
jgi:NTE family protein